MAYGMNLAGWVLLAAGCFGLLTSSVFLGIVFSGVRRIRRWVREEGCELTRRHAADEDYLPPVTLMKPLHGAEPGLELNLRSFYEQDCLRADAAKQPKAEFLFCARYEDDAGLAIARRVAADYPHIATRILTCGEPWAANAKLCSLAVMEREAAHDLWVISDSDVRVEPDYLRSVLLPFADAKVGCLTCLYRGVMAEGAIWSRLEAAGMSIEMSSGVAASLPMEPMCFALGPTMATRRECVREFGGFASIADYCADDFVLGNRVAAHGHKVRLSSCVIDHIVLNTTFMNSWKHQIRWMKSTRFSRPKGHFGTGLTFAVPFGLMALAGGLMVGRAELGAALLAFSVLGRMLQAWVVGRYVVCERKLWRTVLLYPLRDLSGFIFWAMSYRNRRVLWRGEMYVLEAEGRMVPYKKN